MVIRACEPSWAATSITSSSPAAIPAGGCTTMAWQTCGPSGCSAFCTTRGPSCSRIASTLRSPRRSNPSASRARHVASGSAQSRGMGRSYCEHRAHVVAVHVGSRAARDDLAALHHEVLVGERLREIVVLLDQQDRHLAGGGERADGALDVLDDGRLDAFGGLVEDEELWSHGERAADGELLLLPAGKVTPAPSQHLPEHREHLEDARGNLRAPTPRREAHLQVLSHREPAEDLAALR